MDNLQVLTGERIRALRLAAGKALTEVARDLGISAAALSKIENGKTDLNMSRLVQIAHYFAVLVGQLLSENNLSIDTAESLDVFKLQKDLLSKEQEILELQKKIIRLYEKLDS